MSLSLVSLYAGGKEIASSTSYDAREELVADVRRNTANITASNTGYGKGIGGITRILGKNIMDWKYYEDDNSF